jgi:hypothetical protein
VIERVRVAVHWFLRECPSRLSQFIVLGFEFVPSGASRILVARISGAVTIWDNVSDWATATAQLPDNNLLLRICRHSLLQWLIHLRQNRKT